MKTWKKIAALALACLLALSLISCGKNAPEETGGNAPETAESNPAGETPDSSGTDEEITVRVAAMKGPTAMGLVKLMADTENAAETDGNAPEESQEAVGESAYAFTLAASPDEVTPLLIKGDLDIACLPANLASVLYNRTGGEIVCLAINTLGVLYIVENGEEIQSIADLAGKTVAASGMGSTPEYALRYLLAQNGLDPDADVSIDWKNEHSECVAALASGAAAIALLPQPFVTVAQNTLENLRIALDLTAEWDALDNGSALLTGVAVARKAFMEEHPAAVQNFLNAYADSVEWVNANTADAAALIGQYDIVAAPVAEKALPWCNIVCIQGTEMQEKLSGYLQVLYDAAPDAVGGTLPNGDFYYGA